MEVRLSTKSMGIYDIQVSESWAVRGECWRAPHRKVVAEAALLVPEGSPLSAEPQCTVFCVTTMNVPLAPRNQKRAIHG